MRRGARGRRRRRAVELRPRRRLHTSRNAINCVQMKVRTVRGCCRIAQRWGPKKKTPSLSDQEPSISAPSLPPATKLRLERDSVNKPPSAFDPPRLDHHLAEPAPRRRLRLDPEIVPPPPAGARPHIVAPMLIVLMVGCAAVIGLTMISAVQPDAHRPKRTSESIPKRNKSFCGA